MLTKELKHNLHISLGLLNFLISKRGNMLWFFITALALCTAYRGHDTAQQSEHRDYLVHLSSALVVFLSVHELDILLDNLRCRAKKKSHFCFQDEWYFRSSRTSMFLKGCNRSLGQFKRMVCFRDQAGTHKQNPQSTASWLSITHHQENAKSKPLWYHLTPVRMASIQTKQNKTPNYN